MCGIAGILAPLGQAGPILADVRAMTDAVAHRGPDGEGFYCAPGVVLGHRRLAVIDPAGGQQPMYNEDGSVAIVFNGEIYNFAALRVELEALGHVFANRCDTEAIVHAWESFGPDCVSRLHGMFAFALWDSRQNILFCARDRLGKKPFYYSFDRGRLVFASEVSAMQAAGASRRIRARGVADFFAFGYVPEPDTIFEGLRKLPAGCVMTLRQGDAPRIDRYWSPQARTVACSQSEAAGMVRERLQAAVACRLVSDVPLGAFLSGGVDSSAVVAMAAPLRAGKLDTFTIGFEGGEDETPYARMVAERYGTRQHNERAAATDMVGGARAQAAVFGEPFGDSSSVPTLAVCRLARRHATVAVSGDGGDEVFGGYRRYRWHRLVAGVRGYLPSGVRRHAIARLAAIYPKLDRAPRFLRARHTLTELSLDDAMGYAATVARSTAAQRRALFSPWVRREVAGHDPFAPLAAVMGEAHEADPLLQAQLADLATWLPGDILTKVDRASMAASLEVRAPFLDHEVVDWGLSLPAALKIGAGGGKDVLKRALEPLLPREVLYRPKQGFTGDMSGLFRREMGRVRALLLGPVMLGSGFFDADGIGRLLDDHAGGRSNHAQLIWLLLAFEGFLHALEASPEPAREVAEHAA